MGPLLLTLLAQNPAWPSSDPLLGSAELADPRFMPDDPTFRTTCGALELKSFTSTCTPNIPDGEASLGPGIAADRAWLRTVGDPRVTIAVLALGADFSDPELVARWALNANEVQTVDRNADGAVTVLDFTRLRTSTSLPTLDTITDPRLTARADRGDLNGNGLLDPNDLIRLLANGVDEDQNGVIDDIAGYDFIDGDPDPSGPTDNSSARKIAAEANNGIGSLGVCPKCTLIPIRIATSKRAPARIVAKGLAYVAKTVRIAVLPLEPQGGSSDLHAAVAECAASGTLLIAAAQLRGGLATPWTDRGVLFVGSVGPDQELSKATTVFQPRSCVSLSHGPVAPGGCDGTAALLTAGVAGLIASISPTIGPTDRLALLLSSTTLPPLGPGLSPSPSIGTGRIDARRAVDAAASHRIPPSLAIQSPRPFAPIDPFSPFPPIVIDLEPRASMELLVSAERGASPPTDTFTPLARSVERSPTVRSFQITPGLRAEDPAGAPASFHEAAITLRATLTSTVTDLAAEARVTVLTQRDLWAWPAFPRELPSRVSTPPRVVDLDGDQADEIVIATDDGVIFVLDSVAQDRPGWPRRLSNESLTGVAIAGGTLVAASAGGELHVLDVGGRTKHTFTIDGSPTAAPIIADLDADGLDDYVIATETSVDVWSSSGVRVAPFPVELGALIGAPALNERTIGVATAERLFIIEDSRTRSVEFEEPRFDAPTMGPRIGLPPGVVAADVDRDGTVEWIVAPVGRRPFVVRGEEIVTLTSSIRASFGEKAPAKADGEAIFALDGDFAVADFDGDESLELFHRAAPLTTIEGDPFVELEPLFSVWNLTSGAFLDRFPRELTSWSSSEPLVADVDGDRRFEAIYEDGRLIRAVSAIGLSPRGFPKVVSDELAGMAVGDLDGDRRLDLVAVTRMGRVFAWRTRGEVAPWPTARHDPRSSGFASEGLDLRLASNGTDCSCSTEPTKAPASAALWVLILGILVRRRFAVALFVCSTACSIACATVPPKTFDQLEYGYPAERSLESKHAGVSIRVAELGQGPHIVMIHPWGTHMGIWSDVAHELSKSAHVLLLDLPGHGKSSKPPGRYPLRRMALAVIDVMDGVGIERAIIVGNSLGGATAIELARSRPDRVDGLVLLAAPGGAPVPDVIRRGLRSFTHPSHLATFADAGWIVGWWMLVPGSPIAARLRDDMLALRRGPEIDSWARATYSALIEAADYDPPLESIHVPAVVLQGQSDIVVWPSSGRRLAERLPNARLVEIEGCGHFLELECPFEVLREIERIAGIATKE
ncbi:MAG: alpha/beta fold hydrolase [Deltaproteobacteria bacterium]|nr:alpha/beta fold hydrolase [Deltaproteobacteria bacterium]